MKTRTTQISGRGRGSHGGRGRGSGGRNSGKSTIPTKAKKLISDYVFYTGSAKQATDFDSNREYIINHIRKTYNYGDDIGTALEELQEVTDFNEPSLAAVPDDIPASQRSLKAEENKMKYQAELELWMKRKQAYALNRTKAYALLWEQCAKSMKNKIEARSDYSDKIKGNPIELLKAIKEHALNYQEHRYSMEIIFDSIQLMINLKQKENESLQDYTKRFKTAQDVMVSHLGGPIYLLKYMEQMPGYDANDDDKVQACSDAAFKRFMAFTYLHNADQAKYGSLLKGLRTQMSLGQNQYPKTITEANNVLSNHRFDSGSSKKGKSSDDEDDKAEAPSLSFAQLEGKCYCCGKPGHKSPSCRHKNRPKEEWAINKVTTNDAQTHTNVQANTTTTDSNTTQETSHAIVRWTGAHVDMQFFQQMNMRELILLDNQSSTSIFCNPEYVSNIHPVQNKLHLSTNGGVLTANHKAHDKILNIGDVWYDSRAITNIYSMAEVEDEYKVTYNHVLKQFIVHLPSGPITFQRGPNNLYYFRPLKSMSYIQSVQENKLPYTQRQLDRAKKAREMLQSLGSPTVADLKAIIRMNCIKNNPITIEDVNIAEKVFGPDIGSLKGKSTRRKPIPVVQDVIEIPPELITAQKNVVLCMDTMKVNGLPFLTTISKNIMYRTAEWASGTTGADYFKLLTNVIRIYISAGFRVQEIRCDREYASIKNKVEDHFNLQMNLANAQEHVPEAERNNRTLKERIRATFHRLPFNRLPAYAVKVMTMESARKLNFFPAKGGISPYYSPRMIMHHVNLDYNKHCAIPFGTYVQAVDDPDPKNTQAPRTLDCLYMRSNDNYQGGHELLDLRTGRAITRHKVRIVPITKNIIDLVHAMADRDKMPTGLKIETRSGMVIYDSAWIEGVDYDANIEGVDNHTEENKDNQDDNLDPGRHS